MMLAEAQIAGRSRGKRLVGRIKTEKRASSESATMSKRILLRNAQTNKAPSYADGENGMNYVRLQFWGSDGIRYEGMSRHFEDQLVFIETNQLFPVGTEVNVRLTPSKIGPINEGAVQGIVVWQCPSKDHFKNGERFCVSLETHWPRPHGSTETAV